MTYRVRLDLLDAKPPIWRRLDVASDLYLDDLHVVVQAAMGWSDSHLHAFSAGGRVFMPGSFQFLNEFDVAEGERGTPEAQVRLDEVLREPGDRLWYTYDFGDGWDHVLKLESVQTRRAGDAAFRCVGGRRACPPEDCGGIPGYEDLLAYREDPASVPDWVAERAAEFWAAGNFDPAEFSVAETNDALDAIRA